MARTLKNRYISHLRNEKAMIPTTSHTNLIDALQRPTGPEMSPSICYCRQTNPSRGTVFLRENILIFVEKGNVLFRHGEMAYRIGAHQAAFIKGDILLDFDQDNKGEFAFFSFFLNLDIVVEFIKLTSLPVNSSTHRKLVTITPSHAAFMTFMASMKPYLGQGRTMVTSLIRIKLLELLFCISYCDRQVLDQILDVRERFRSDIKQVVEENITSALNLNELARLAGRSISSFRRDFRLVYNKSPSRWIRQKRLEKAQEMLVGTNMTIAGICYTLGYESPAHFSRTFKLHFGCCPSEVRLGALVA
ncbi:MAG: AraC family transcriptional regulator [Chitinophagaceae bacterium]